MILWRLQQVKNHNLALSSDNTIACWSLEYNISECPGMVMGSTQLHSAAPGDNVEGERHTPC